MSQYKRTVDVLKKNKALREAGKHIVIPFPFQRFGEHIPGIQQSKYYLLSGNQKAAKTQIADFLFMYSPLEFIMNTETNIKLKIFRFELEMDKHSKLKQAICYRLFQKKGIVLSPAKIESLYQSYILPDDILRFIEEDREWFDKLESIVETHDSVRNAFGIYKAVRAHFEANGTYEYKNVDFTDEEGNKKTEKVVDRYIPNNPDLFTLILVDNINLLLPERGGTLFDAIGKFSSDYMVRIRNIYGGTPVIIQQQALFKEGNDSIKLDRTKPSADGLSDNKCSSKDCNMLLTVYSPYRNRILTYPGNDGYNIARLKDNFRELTVELNRDGIMCSSPLYFNGAVNWFSELPKPADMTPDIYNQITENKYK